MKRGFLASSSFNGGTGPSSNNDNAVVIIEKQGKEMGPKGNRVFGPVARELTERGWQNIASLAPEIV